MRVIDCHGHLPGNLAQHLGVVLAESAFSMAAGHGQRAESPFAVDQRNPDSRLHAHSREVLTDLRREGPVVNACRGSPAARVRKACPAGEPSDRKQQFALIRRPCRSPRETARAVLPLGS